MFCLECGSFIAIGSKVFSGGSSTTSVAAAMAAPASAVAGTGSGRAGVSGTVPLGSYSTAMAAYERTSRRRLLLAAISVVLVAVVGLSAIYAALTRNGGGDTPTPAAALLAAPSPGPTAPAAEAGDADPAEAEVADTPAVQAIEEVAAEPEPEMSPPAVPASTEPAAVEASQPVEVAAEPLDAGGASARVEATDTVRATGPQVPSEAAGSGQGRASNAPVWRSGWVCDGELSLKDERLRDWAITRVSFLPGNGFERVVLQLERVGDGSGGAATMTAEAFPTGRVKQEVSAVRQPSAGRTTIALEFRGGVRSEIGLRRYRPIGLSSIKEFNAYAVGQTASRVLVSSSTNGCFKVRAPAFRASPNAQRGQLLIDIKS